MAERGRPKKPKRELREDRLEIVLTKAERRAIDEHASRMGMAPAVYVRAAALGVLQITK